ncbi:mandelate racemase/muconate lactonizing enzyme family protein [Allomesorhizobium camelthorni]|uniref:Mandelate racemase/muconate lactonizing enzyme family protein n=1 Tax=Allomesorhizobium camelthorni TaxID=475069 RepID=A0A6G4WHN4_9HYPH|nr:mandelate racemase/muconate lactonizing enzyme family protein [Mesorhizobium camelthorni]NGO53878.1 mandelate racemase/muconate lactonizing enzyme family protein [Mesorhizobium camelthorni]
MKIATIELYEVTLPYSGGVYQLSGGREYRHFDAVIVRVEADDGTEGWGESTPFGGTYIAAHARGARAGVEEIAPHLLGRDPRQTDRIYDAMDEVLVGHNHAKAAIDAACWDLFGKSVNRPVCELLGGSTGIPMATISSIYAGAPEEMRERVVEHRSRGYLGHSIKIGALDHEGGPMLDSERIRACLADRQPGEYFIADANGGLVPETAMRMLRLLPDGLDFVLEAPCSTWRETLSLRRHCTVPIILDELVMEDENLARLIALDAADGIGLKITKAGGLTPSRRQRDLCRAAGLTMSVQDTVGSDIAYAAIVHMGATVPPRLLRCILNSRDMVTLETARFDPVMRDGRVLPPDAPGLGINVNREALGAPVQAWSL